MHEVVTMIIVMLNILATFSVMLAFLNLRSWLEDNMPRRRRTKKQEGSDAE